MNAIRRLAKRLLFLSFVPGRLTRPLFSLWYSAFWYGRELFEWVRRACVATPVFLSRCDTSGVGVSVDRIPYMTGRCRIEIGNQVRISGKIGIEGTSTGRSRLRIGNGVFIGHGCGFGVASGVEIGDFVAIGGQTFITDTEGHSTYNPRRAIWEVPASHDDVSPVVIEDNVQIGRYCVILKGVRIGARSIVGAGSVLRSSVPPDSVVMGNPARVVKRLVAGD
jgi:acetyltransferase-like isoleucine patch superfamily enzyme